MNRFHRVKGPWYLHASLGRFVSLGEDAKGSVRVWRRGLYGEDDVRSLPGIVSGLAGGGLEGAHVETGDVGFGPVGRS